MEKPKAQPLSPAQQALYNMEHRNDLKGPKLIRKSVVRSSQRSDGYRYNDWRNW
jgi:hypothetical protein